MSKRMAIVRVGIALVAASLPWWVQPFSYKLQTPLLIGVILAAGVLIARWRALLIALSPTLFATAMSTADTEDTRGFLIYLIGINIGAIELVLLTLGVAAAKIAAAVWRERRSSGAGAHP